MNSTNINIKYKERAIPPFQLPHPYIQKIYKLLIIFVYNYK